MDAVFIVVCGHLLIFIHQKTGVDFCGQYDEKNGLKVDISGDSVDFDGVLKKVDFDGVL